MAGCRPPGDEVVSPDGSSSGTGGQKSGSGGSASGGSTSTGGSASGGSPSGSGGAASGGSTSTGGSPSSSGGAATGGGTSSGGRAGATAGGTNGGGGRGGTSAGGGRTGSGGVTATGGRTGSGGSTTTGSGGGTSSGGSNGTGGTTGSGGSNAMQPPPITSGGTTAWASRYWDCCKPACGWKGNVRSGNPMTSCNEQNMSLSDANVVNACQTAGSNSAYMCWSGVPWSVSDTLSYGFAAASGNNYTCGRCFQAQFTGSGHSGSPANSLNGKTMIVQVINNGGVQADQFDLLIPGGGVGALNACSAQWGTSDLGAQYGGFLAGCNGSASCVMQKCSTVFANKPDLMAGCNWFLGWFAAADNPAFVYKQIACPAAITQKSGLSDPG
ncbi:MAG TPA: hypothetical protein VGP07_18730 [Polyangia bacterium]